MILKLKIVHRVDFTTPRSETTEITFHTNRVGLNHDILDEIAKIR